VLPETAYSIRVGMQQSNAKFNLLGQPYVVRLLEELAGK